MVQFGLSRVCAAGYKVIYDSSGGNKFTVNKPDGIQMQFSQSAQGLFYIDTKETGMVFINTVADNQSKQPTVIILVQNLLEKFRILSGVLVPEHSFTSLTTIFSKTVPSLEKTFSPPSISLVLTSDPFILPAGIYTHSGFWYLLMSCRRFLILSSFLFRFDQK